MADAASGPGAAAGLPTITADQATHVDVSAGLEPRLRVKLGERFVIETQDTSYGAVDGGHPPRFDAPPLAAYQYVRANPVGGPVYVEGVEPGDTLVVAIDDVEVRDWGWTGMLPKVGPLAGRAGWADLEVPFATVIRHERGQSGTYADGTATMNVGRPVSWPLAPFIGTLMVAPERGSENTVISQAAWGGNIDVRDIRAGNRVHLNATHPGGLLFAGDVHGSQGDSELTGVANETAARLTLRCDVIKGEHFPGVARIETPDSLIQCTCMRMTGGAERTIEAAYLYMLDWLTTTYGMDRREAALHMTADSRVRGHIYQATNGALVVGVEFPKAAL